MHISFGLWTREEYSNIKSADFQRESKVTQIIQRILQIKEKIWNCILRENKRNKLSLKLKFFLVLVSQLIFLLNWKNLLNTESKRLMRQRLWNILSSKLFIENRNIRRLHPLFMSLCHLIIPYHLQKNMSQKELSLISCGWF